VGVNAVAPALNEECLGPRKYAVQSAVAASAVVQMKSIEATIAERVTVVFDFMMLSSDLFWIDRCFERKAVKCL
jgi:hypothetical protein